MEQVVAVLNATLSPDNNVRQNAEDALAKLAQSAGLAMALLQLINSTEAANETRLAASLALKNFVRNNWSGDGEAPLEEAERVQIREALLQTIFAVPTAYRRQLSQTVCYIAKSDFPGKWFKLIEVIGGCMTSATDFDRLSAALITLDELVRRYRYESRSNALWLEIIDVVKVVAEPLTQLFSNLLLYLPKEGEQDGMSLADRELWSEILLLVAKIYHSLISQDLPEYFEDNLTPWMNGFIMLLKTRIDVIEQNALDTETTNFDKLKCSICQIVTLYSQRYEECFQQFTIEFITATWQLLVSVNSRVRFDSLVNAALGFLSSICQRQQYAENFLREGVLEEICQNIIVRNLVLRSEDLEMYESEPFEYLKRDMEGSDLETRRRGVTDLVRALCKFFEAKIFEIFSTIIQTFLAEYEQNPASNFVKKDAVYFLVSAIASKTSTERLGATSTSQLIDVSDFYERVVRLDLLDGDVNSLPVLRGAALKYLVLFRNQLKPEYLVECVCGIDNRPENSIIRLLSSNHVLLHHYVAFTLERLFLMRDANKQLLFTPTNVPVKLFVERLFNGFKAPGACNTHYLMKALMRCFSLLDDNSAQQAHLYVIELEKMIAQAIQNPINPQLVHFMFEALCVLIRKAYTKVEGGLDRYVIGIVELIIPRDVIDFVPYALQVIALLLDQSRLELQQGHVVPQDQYLNFFNYLLRAEFWSRTSNIPALMLVLESYITCFPQVILGPQFVDQILGVFQRMIASKVHDTNGFRLAAALLPYADVGETTKLTSRDLLLPMLNRLQQLKTTKYSKLFTLFLLRYAVVKGGQQLAMHLESIQAGIFRMVVERVLLVEMRLMPQTTTFDEKRLISVGVAALISEAVVELGSEDYATLVEEAIAVLEAFDHRKAMAGGRGDGTDEAAAAEAAQLLLLDQYGAETNDMEYSDPYCKLSYAQHFDSVGKNVSNVRKHLADAVAKAHSMNPASSDCLSAKAKNVLSAYAIS